MTGLVERKHCLENAQFWKKGVSEYVICFCWIFFAYALRQFSQNLVDLKKHFLHVSFALLFYDM